MAYLMELDELIEINESREARLNKAEIAQIFDEYGKNVHPKIVNFLQDLDVNAEQIREIISHIPANTIIVHEEDLYISLRLLIDVEDKNGEYEAPFKD